MRGSSGVTLSDHQRLLRALRQHQLLRRLRIRRKVIKPNKTWDQKEMRVFGRSVPSGVRLDWDLLPIPRLQVRFYHAAQSKTCICTRFCSGYGPCASTPANCGTRDAQLELPTVLLQQAAGST